MLNCCTMNKYDLKLVVRLVVTYINNCLIHKIEDEAG